ncbi:MAG TPA: hypothetical protein VF169_24125 [Albitalea sp.]
MKGPGARHLDEVGRMAMREQELILAGYSPKARRINATAFVRWDDDDQ